MTTDTARAWADRLAPSIDDFERLAADAFQRLPDGFRERCRGVSLLVMDYPTDDMLEALELESEYDLLGLYEGVDLTQAGASDTKTDLDRVYLFRRPLLDEWAEGEDTLGELVINVLVHEIGHHFGLSDEEMELLEADLDEG